MMIFIGGIGSLHGAIYGAIFLIALPQLIAVAKDFLPAAIGHQTGLEPTVFGLILVLVIVFEPLGIYGRWLKVRHYLQTFPLYKQDIVPPPADLHEIGARAMSFLSVENLSIQFGGIKAVDDVSFEVNAGEVFTIIGPNGAGKTTIFNLICRLYAPTGGASSSTASTSRGSPPHEIAGLGIARTFQNIELFEHATVLDNLLIGRHCHRRTGLLADLLFLPRVQRAERASARRSSA